MFMYTYAWFSCSHRILIRQADTKWGFTQKSICQKKPTTTNHSLFVCACSQKKKKIQNLSVSISIIIANYSSSWKQWVNESPYGSILTNSWFVVQLFSIITSQLFFGLGHFKSRRLIVALFIKSRSLNYFFFQMELPLTPPNLFILDSFLFVGKSNRTPFDRFEGDGEWIQMKNVWWRVKMTYTHTHMSTIPVQICVAFVFCPININRWQFVKSSRPS